MISEQDISQFRRETAGTQNALHFNNAGSSLPPDCVHNAVTLHLERERQIGGYEAKDEAQSAISSFYDETSKLIGANPNEIAFIENATRAWDMAFYSLPFVEGDEIITVASEYASNYLAYLQIAKRKGVVIKVATNEPNGQADVDSIRKLVTSRTKLISITHVPSTGGLINPAEAIGKIAKEHGILYLLDACQSVGQLPIDVKTIGCDMLSATGRKFLRGPRGTGFLYVRESLANSLEPAFIDLHAAHWETDNTYTIIEGAKRFENWECFYAGKIGLAEAVRYAIGIGLDHIAARNKILADHLRKGLQNIAGVNVTDLGVQKSAIVTFEKSGIDPEQIKAQLRHQRINVSVSPASYSRLDLAARKLNSVVRASIHYYNTEDEIAQFIAAVKSIK
jgi:cysteine desulfurase / selenocysteine lyase